MTGVELLVIVLASAAAAVVKGVTGLGYPLVAVPLITFATGVEDAVIVVALPNFAANAWLCAQERHHRSEARDTSRLVGPGIAGAVVGTLLLVNLPEDPLLALLAATVAVFVVMAIRSPELRIDPVFATRWAPGAGFLGGIMQGSVGAAGPVVATWLHGYRLPKNAYVFSITLFFLVTGGVQIVMLGVDGRFDGDHLLGTAFAAVPLLVLLPVGVAWRGRLGGPAFERAVLIVLAFSAVSLVGRILS